MKLRPLAMALAVAVPAAVGLAPEAPLQGPRAAEASVAVLISLDDLVAGSTYVVIATAAEQHSAWEDLPSGRRIVTYTRLVVERPVAGSPGSEIMVRTLGGVVDKIGQAVSGEAQIAVGSRSLLFLTKTADTTVVVTAMAQGHFPLVASEGKNPEIRLAPSPDAGTLLPRRGPTISARERLVGATLDEAVAAVKRVQRTPDDKK